MFLIEYRNLRKKQEEQNDRPLDEPSQEDGKEETQNKSDTPEEDAQKIEPQQRIEEKKAKQELASFNPYAPQ